MRKILEKEESKRYKQNGQSAAQKYRSVIPNLEQSRYTLIATSYGVTGILIPRTHLGDYISPALAVKQ